MLRTAGEGAARFTGHGRGREEGFHGDGDTVLHTWLQVGDDRVVLVTKSQTELQHHIMLRTLAQTMCRILKSNIRIFKHSPPPRMNLLSFGGSYLIKRLNL